MQEKIQENGGLLVTFRSSMTVDAILKSFVDSGDFSSARLPTTTLIIGAIFACNVYLHRYESYRLMLPVKELLTMSGHAAQQRFKSGHRMREQQICYRHHLLESLVKQGYSSDISSS